MGQLTSETSLPIGVIPEGLSPDDVYAVLADPDRLRVLGVLRQLEVPERLSSLARNLAMEAGRTGPDEVRRLHLRLYHCHVPKMSDAGLVAYDESRGTVELTEEGRALAEALER